MTGEFVQEQASVAQGEQADGNWANALAESPSPAECLKGSQIGAKEERGLEVRGQSHLQYNSDGRYIREAACFVYRKYAAIQGTGGAKV
jgi:hypothetical protein